MDMLALVELSGMEERMTNQLSGGQQQRVALARALVMQPGVLLFDEPLSNLDAKLRVAMRTEIRKIQQKLGITAVYVTHDQAEAMSLSDEIILMNKGQIAQKGTPQEIYYKPRNEFVADFIGEVSFLEGRVKSADGIRCTVAVSGAEIEAESYGTVSAGNACKIVLRPESVGLKDSGQIPCEVVFSTFMGAYQYYQVKTCGTVIKINDYNPRGKKVYKVGDTASLDFDKAALHIL